MFRIIVENRNYVLIEGIKNIKSFASDHILIHTGDTFLELYGRNFCINELGEGYLHLCGEISEIKYITPEGI